ncbi:Gfo/Idh/MocA family protein [Haloferula sargassicola]|uniref:Inositol 2-dehydrogenase/D-chiro-inositol 3-dehydrogenase n=1 Tax=Haloferula sargassicola TaxID=490096 RepID=A0ABP9UR03_9BACT
MSAKPYLTSRRHFIQGAGALAFATFAAPSFGAVGANDRIRLALIGCGGRGNSLFDQFSGEKDVEFVAFADPDQQHLDKIGEKAPKAEKFTDYRKLLERKDIDAVVIASPNYWHAIHTIHACQAGKDVYVEKPVTFSLEQGQAMLAAEKKYDRIIQAGTQNRSDTGLIDAFQAIQEGKFGKILQLRGLCYRNRTGIGKLDHPLEIPASVDYNLWLGPRPDEPIRRPHLHYDWHWDYNTGNGDIGNQAPHEFDLISWLLGDPRFSGDMHCLGNRFGWDDAGNTPNLQTAWYEMAGVPVVFEVNDMTLKPDVNASPAFKGVRVGIVATCEGGEFRGGRGGGFVVGEDGKTKIAKFPGDAGGGHARNFLDAVKSRDASSLRGKLAHAVHSAEVVHLANLAYRAGEPVPRTKLVGDLPETIADVIERQERQLKAWSIDTEKTPYVLGAPAAMKNGQPQGGAKLMSLADTTYREGFPLPEIS